MRVPYTVVTPEDWGGVGGYPLGQWIAEQRRAYMAGTLGDGRVAELEKLGMVWSEQDVAWADGISVAKEYAVVHGHFLPPDHRSLGGASDRCVGEERPRGSPEGTGWSCSSSARSRQAAPPIQGWPRPVRFER
ncbi:helicase associated domain-containing protein [Streptomyces sp. NPDC059849]|uniref:helicase associated domain-containing protein n=1 Tax=Streptomyces sp. NPDC059849 TaxID=3346969 RepID=UPI00364B4921